MLRFRVRIVTKSLRQSQTELRGKNDFITLLLDSTAEGIVAVSSESRCVLCNASFASLLGYEKGADVIGRNLFDVVVFCPEGDGPSGQRHDVDWQGADRGRHFEKAHLRRRDGSSFFAEVWFWPIKNDKGAASGTVLTLIDITDRIEAEKSRADKEIAERSNHAKSAFIAKMSHELRTPLNSVIVLTGILRRHLSGKIDETDYSYLEVVERNGNFLLQQINEILDISRIEAGNDAPVLAVCDVHALALECVRSVEPLAAQKKLSLDFAANVTEARVMTDANKFRHIIQNILSNAIKYTPRGGIRVTLMVSGPEVSFEVEDSGVGIDEKDLPHIFDDFYQVSDTVEMRQGGVGLGLSIAKRYADQIGASLSVESEKGKGSVFRLGLSRGSESGEASSPSASLTAGPATPEGDSARKRVKNEIPTVLIIDDNPDSRTAEIALLRDTCSIISAENGYDGIALALKEHPDFIMLDISMPILSGYDTLRLIRQLPAIADIVVIAVTASITKADRDSILRSGFDAFIPKPIDYESLRATLRRFMV
jgi:PAS domain S-box-containing protein